jgi:riboflavin kinase/FMN adenylyltransferase
MVLLRRLEKPHLYRGGYVSIGNFDGVHNGHRRIIARAAERARRDQVPAVAMTFDPHPIKLLRPEQAPKELTTLDHKAELLEQAGASCVIAYPTDRKLLRLTPEEFFDAIVISELRAKGLVEGPNFCFGRDRRGDIGTLRDLCRLRGVELDVLDPVGGGEQMVSSSAIRSLLAAGRLDEAVGLLGHPYRLRGRVVSGARRGQSLGFPTANLAGIENLVPGEGVYAGRFRLGDEWRPAAVNVGSNPTFGDEERKVEVHVLDFAGDLYGRTVEVDLLKRIRDVRRFAGRDELVRQLADDVAAARAAAERGGSHPGPPGL